jgi:hypothetical protein
MSAIVEVGFDYSSLSGTDRDEVRAATARIRVRMTRTVEDIVQIGQDLILVKERVGHGGFILWIEAEFGMSEWTARSFMRVGERFGKSGTVPDLPAAVLYALAAPSTPDAVVDEIKERAANGQHVTRDDVKELKEKLKEQKAKAQTAKADADAFYKQLQGAEDRLKKLQDERSSLDAQIAHLQDVGRVAVLPATRPVSTPDAPMNDSEAYNAWLAEGVKWFNRGSADWRERAREHLYREASVMDRRFRRAE